MNNLKRNILNLIAVTSVITACGGDGSDDRKNDESNARAEAPRNESACHLLQFDDVERFTSNDYLYFSFEHPQGWLHKPSASGMAGHGFVHAPGNDRVGIEYVLSPTPMTANSPFTQIRESSMTRLEPLVYGGVEVQPYGKMIGRNMTLGLMLPHADVHYDLVFNFHGPGGCDEAMIKHLRTLVLRSLEPNPSTSFAH